MAYVYNNLAILYKQIGKYDDALQCIHTAIEIASSSTQDKR